MDLSVSSQEITCLSTHAESRLTLPSAFVPRRNHDIAHRYNWAALTLFSLSPLTVQRSLPQTANNVPKGANLATDLGRVDRNQPQTPTVLLKTHNQADYDKAVEDLYDPESSSYHQWFSEKDFAKYAPHRDRA